VMINHSVADMQNAAVELFVASCRCFVGPVKVREPVEIATLMIQRVIA
jgi:hypothetical protein